MLPLQRDPKKVVHLHSSEDYDDPANGNFPVNSSYWPEAGDIACSITKFLNVHLLHNLPMWSNRFLTLHTSTPKVETVCSSETLIFPYMIMSCRNSYHTLKRTAFMSLQWTAWRYYQKIHLRTSAVPHYTLVKEVAVHARRYVKANTDVTSSPWKVQQDEHWGYEEQHLCYVLLGSDVHHVPAAYHVWNEN